MAFEGQVYISQKRAHQALQDTGLLLVSPAAFVLTPPCVSLCNLVELLREPQLSDFWVLVNALCWIQLASSPPLPAYFSRLIPAPYHLPVGSSTGCDLGKPLVVRFHVSSRALFTKVSFFNTYLLFLAAIQVLVAACRLSALQPVGSLVPTQIEPKSPGMEGGFLTTRLRKPIVKVFNDLFANRARLLIVP